MIELKAELMKKKQEFEESKQKKQKTKTEQLKTVNKSIVERPSSQLEEDQLKKSREALEIKSRLYHRLERGKLMESELSAGQRENLMVDFAWKGWNPETGDFEFESSDCENEEDFDIEASREPLKMDQVMELLETCTSEDKWIEYEDEFGRTRVSKLSQLRQDQADRQELCQTLNLSSSSHYDGDAEIRNKGVAFYQFARDEEERQRQMQELRKLREETVERRVRTLILKEQRKLKIESRLNRLRHVNTQKKAQQKN